MGKWGTGAERDKLGTGAAGPWGQDLKETSCGHELKGTRLGQDLKGTSWGHQLK